MEVENEYRRMGGTIRFSSIYHGYKKVLLFSNIPLSMRYRNFVDGPI